MLLNPQKMSTLQIYQTKYYLFIIITITTTTRELFEKAVNTFDTATDLVNGGNIEAAIPLYHNVSIFSLIALYFLIINCNIRHCTCLN